MSDINETLMALAMALEKIAAAMAAPRSVSITQDASGNPVVVSVPVLGGDEESTEMLQ